MRVLTVSTRRYNLYSLPMYEQQYEAYEELTNGLARAGIFKHSMGARNRVGIALSYRPAGLHRLAELIPLNRFLGSINV